MKVNSKECLFCPTSLYFGKRKATSNGRKLFWDILSLLGQRWVGRTEQLLLWIQVILKKELGIPFFRGLLVKERVPYSRSNCSEKLKVRPLKLLHPFQERELF